jgi:hypothetical protein
MGVGVDFAGMLIPYLWTSIIPDGGFSQFPGHGRAIKFLAIDPAIGPYMMMAEVEAVAFFCCLFIYESAPNKSFMNMNTVDGERGEQNKLKR